MRRGHIAGRHGPDPIDRHIGSRLRLRRTLLGVSQATLGEGIDVSFQQIQKYERGINRVSASMLYQFSRVLEVSVGFFFDDMPPDLAVMDYSRWALGDKSNELRSTDDISAKRETLELMRAYHRIGGEKTRRAILHLLRTIAYEGQSSN
ncbi:MAG TPA: helix-turn-helix transcriptional regulator [Stellaceae bacterium]|nr:helix-turn-helix transcriptional regulator [Stellaceae bacterium]